MILLFILQERIAPVKYQRCGAGAASGEII
jgi:hypothetical protein